MSKYSALRAYLGQQWTTEVPMTFAEIERVIGSKLPAAAHHHRAWWSNNPSNNVMTKEWLGAGFRSEQVDMAGQKLVFRRTASVRTAEASSIAPAMQDSPREFHATERSGLAPRRHPLFGALRGMVRVLSDVDLTKPAMPEWADLLDEQYGNPESR